MDPRVLEIKKLNVSFKGSKNIIVAADNVNLYLQKGETTALVGESGSGKSVTALSILGLLPYPSAFHKQGKIIFRKLISRLCKINWFRFCFSCIFSIKRKM